MSTLVFVSHADLAFPSVSLLMWSPLPGVSSTLQLALREPTGSLGFLQTIPGPVQSHSHPTSYKLISHWLEDVYFVFWPRQEPIVADIWRWGSGVEGSGPGAGTDASESRPTGSDWIPNSTSYPPS